MERLIHLFVEFVAKIRSLVGLVFPMFAEAADFRSWPRWIKVLVHLIVLGCIVAGLLWLNSFPAVQNLLKTRATKFVSEYYLVLVFFLLYFLSWVGYFIWRLLTRTDAAEFPDVEAAWDDAVKRLAQGGIRLGDAPLYLVVGKPASDVDGLLLASGQKVQVRAPLAVDSPLRVFANRDAIFVTCAGASAWGRFADALADPDSVSADGMGTDDPTKTITPGQALQGVDAATQQEFKDLLRIQSDRALTDAEEARLRELGEQINRAKDTAPRRVSLPAEEQAVGPRRLAYLCRLIARDRRPWCPANGVLALVPWAALESDETARVAVPLLAEDLAAARQAFAQRYPHFVMVCDLEQADGFAEFRRGFPKEMLKQRIGQRLPLVPDRPADEVPGVLAQAADWIRLNVMASWVLKFLRLDWPPEQRKTNEFVPGSNRRLFQFLHDVYVRGPRLGRLLARGLPADPGGSSADDPSDALPLVGGCYLAATGRDEKDQAFVAGVFQRLTESQSSVSWSGRAEAEDRAYRRWAGLLWVAALVLAAVTAAGGYVLFGQQR